MRLTALLVLLVACGGSPQTQGPPVGAGSQPTTAAPAAKPDADAPTRSDVKVHGNLPIMTESELAAQDQARANCLDRCDPDDDSCAQQCHEEFPIQQVEVVPDSPIEPPE